MLPPASRVSWLPGALIPVLAARSQVTPSARVMLPVACRSICEKPVKAELTFKLRVPGWLVDVTVPDPALPVPLLPIVMLTGSISSPPPGLPAPAWPSITRVNGRHSRRGNFDHPARAALRAAGDADGGGGRNH